VTTTGEEEEEEEEEEKEEKEEEEEEEEAEEEDGCGILCCSIRFSKCSSDTFALRIRSIHARRGLVRLRFSSPIKTL